MPWPWAQPVIIINKVELVSAEQLGQVSAVVRQLNADAVILPTSHSNVPLTEILNTHRFSLDKAQEAAGWLKQLRYVTPSRHPSGHRHRRLTKTRRPTPGRGLCPPRLGEHVPETLEYGISSFVFRARRPFHPERLHELVFVSNRYVPPPPPGALPRRERAWRQRVVGSGEGFPERACRLQSVVRSKGFFWIATRMDVNGQWAQAGRRRC